MLCNVEAMAVRSYLFSELCAEAEVTHKRSEIMSMYRANLVIIRGVAC